MDQIDLQRYVIDASSIVVYYADIETDELYFLNSTGERLLSLEKKDWEYKKYYEVFQHFVNVGTPKSSELVEDKFFVVQSYISPLEKYFRINLIIKELHGKKVRFGIAQDITESVLHTINMEDKLKEQEIINACLELLLKPVDMHIAIHSLLKMLCDYYQADRVHVVHIPSDTSSKKEVFEYALKQDLQATQLLEELTIQDITTWFAQYSQHDVISFQTTEDLDSSSELFTQNRVHNFIAIPLHQGEINISSLLASPLRENHADIIGFIGIVNPTVHFDNKHLMRNIAKFYENFYIRSQFTNTLYQLSNFDSMTGLQNRNCFEEKHKQLSHQKYKNLGILYIDVNELKHINDTQGHDAGDALIQLSAQLLKKSFNNNAYRIGGDEFIIVLENILEKDFQKEVAKLEKNIAQDIRISLALGAFWNDGSMLISQHIHEAESKMYTYKKNYYEKNSRRKN